MPITQGTQLHMPERKEFTPVKPGAYQVQLMDIKERMKKGFQSNEEEPFLAFDFVIITPGEAYGRHLFKDVRAVKPIPMEASGNQSWIWRIMSALNGNPIPYDTGSKMTAEDINGTIGQQLMLAVNQTPPKNGKVYNNVIDVYPAENYLSPFVADNVKEKEAAVAPAVQVQPAAARTPQPKATVPAPVEPAAFEPPTEKQLDLIYQLMLQKGKTPKDLTAAGFPPPELMSKQQAIKCGQWLLTSKIGKPKSAPSGKDAGPQTASDEPTYEPPSEEVEIVRE